jgi:hypothetical protein
MTYDKRVVTTHACEATVDALCVRMGQLVQALRDAERALDMANAVLTDMDSNAYRDVCHKLTPAWNEAHKFDSAFTPYGTVGHVLGKVREVLADGGAL